jgi:hypothetical protein
VTEPTDPTTAAATIRRAATAMRDVANGVGTVGHDWTINPPEPRQHEWTIGSCGNTVTVAETPDYGGLELPDHIASWAPPRALLVADVLDALADEMAEGSAVFVPGGVGSAHLAKASVRLVQGEPDPAWTTAYKLATAFLAVRPEGD